MLGTSLVLLVALIGITSSGLSYAGVSGAIESVMQEAHQTVEKVSTLAEEKQERFKEQLQGQIEKLEREIERLRQEASSLQDDDVRLKLEPQLEILQAQKEAIILRLNKIREGSGEAWKELKQGLLNALEDLKQSIERASQALQRQ
ncbi:MAG: hypothetical protein D6690_15600 [Nitrospirae bacterium]|nr:MAG: hypothetical protein D6690_15600 [Nitrospirota bacterium]